MNQNKIRASTQEEVHKRTQIELGTGYLVGTHTGALVPVNQWKKNNSSHQQKKRKRIHRRFSIQQTFLFQSGFLSEHYN